MIGMNSYPFTRPAPGLTLRACKHGYFLYFPHDQYIGQSLDLYGEYSELEVSFLSEFVREGDTIIDAGANIGAITLPLARMVGMPGRVFAFEPQRVIHQMLCANVALNSYWNTFTYHAALAASGVRGLRVPPINYAAPGNFGNVELDGTSGEGVVCMAIDEMGLDVRLIKIDVQGMESDVLHGAEFTINRCRPFLYVENDRRDQQLIELMHKLGYNLYWHQPLLFNAANYRGVEHNVFPTIVSQNIFGAPKELSLALDMRRVTGTDPAVL